MTTTKPRNITVIWETVPDADQEAIDKAFAMLFRRGAYFPKHRRFDKTGDSANVQGDEDH